MFDCIQYFHSFCEHRSKNKPDWLIFICPFYLNKVLVSSFLGRTLGLNLIVCKKYFESWFQSPYRTSPIKASVLWVNPPQRISDISTRLVQGNICTHLLGVQISNVALVPISSLLTVYLLREMLTQNSLTWCYVSAVWFLWHWSKVSWV